MIKEKIKTMDKKIVYGISLVIAGAVLGAGYLFFREENSYAEAPKGRSAGVRG